MAEGAAGLCTAVGPRPPEAASAKPNASNSSAVEPTPGLFWVKVWLLDPVSPVGVPYSTLTAPTARLLPMDSNGTPTARCKAQQHKRRAAEVEGRFAEHAGEGTVTQM